MKHKFVAVLFVAIGTVGVTTACSGNASADSVVIVDNQSSTSTGSVDCIPASVAANFPWLPVPVCP